MLVSPHCYLSVIALKLEFGCNVQKRNYVFFNETINAPRHLLELFINQLDDVEPINGYFKQDSATAHTAQTAINYLEEFFPGRSSNLNLLDFFLFLHLKNVMFTNSSKNLQKQAIEDATANVELEMLTSPSNNLHRKVQCLCSNVDIIRTYSFLIFQLPKQFFSTYAYVYCEERNYHQNDQHLHWQHIKLIMLQSFIVAVFVKNKKTGKITLEENVKNTN